jgi:hypothetical protein
MKIISDSENKAVYEMYEANKEFFASDKSDRNSSSDIFLLLDKFLRNVNDVEELEKIDLPKEYLDKINLVEELLNEL